LEREAGYRKMKNLIWICFIIIVFAPSIQGQEENPARKLFEDAIEAMGGSAFLNVTDMVSEGNYFVFDRFGASSPLIKFTDYTRLPGKSRFELGNKKKELEITIFNLEKNEGWILEGQKEAKAATPDEMRDFRNTVKHSLDIIFRIRYKDPDNSLFYFGPGEGKDLTLEKVKLIDSDNDEVTVYFDRLSKLPMKIEYKSVDQKGTRQRVVQEFSQWHWIKDVRTSLRTDGYINGRQSFQSHILTIKYNNDLPDTLFEKPVPPK
jgi:hypothetical protein